MNGEQLVPDLVCKMEKAGRRRRPGIRPPFAGMPIWDIPGDHHRIERPS